MSLNKFSESVYVLILLLFVVKIKSQDCGQSRHVDTVHHPMVTGVENATEGSWPWMVAITHRSTSDIYTPWCTGFLIDRRHVISAAHCYSRRDPKPYRARIGRTNIDEAVEYLITQIVFPEGYTEGRYYDDIAILTLDREVNFPNFNPICLPDEQVSGMNLVGKATTEAGWASNTPNGDLLTNLQQLSLIPVVSNKQCNRVYRENIRSSFLRQFPSGITDDIICAGFEEGGKSFCHGISGAPLMILNRKRWFAVGVSSFGLSCRRTGIPNGYMKVSSYLDWIEQTTSV